MRTSPILGTETLPALILTRRGIRNRALSRSRPLNFGCRARSSKELVKVLEDLLQRLRVGLPESRGFGLLLERGQLRRELRQRDRLPRRGVVAFPAAQGPVPDPTTSTGHAVEGMTLCRRRPHPGATDLAMLGQGSHSFLVLDELLDDGQRCSAYRQDCVGVRPQGRDSAPEPGEFLAQGPGRTSPGQFDGSADAEPGIDLHQEVDVIGHHLHLDDLGARFRGAFGEELLEPFVHAVHQHGTAELGAPDDVYLQE